MPPFKRAIDEGVDAIMVAHVNAPDFQDHAEDPASLSKFWFLNDLKARTALNLKKGVLFQDYFFLFQR